MESKKAIKDFIASVTQVASAMKADIDSKIKSMSPEQAKIFSEQMKAAQVDKRVMDLKVNLNELKNFSV